MLYAMVVFCFCAINNQMVLCNVQLQSVNKKLASYICYPCVLIMFVQAIKLPSTLSRAHFWKSKKKCHFVQKLSKPNKLNNFEH